MDNKLFDREEYEEQMLKSLDDKNRSLEIEASRIFSGIEDLGKKESEGKTVYSELDWDYIDSMADRMSDNKDKYPPKNWQKRMNVIKLAESSIRHARKILQTKENDPETAEDHAVALGCNGMIMAYQLKNYKDND